MLRRSNKRKNKPDKSIETRPVPQERPYGNTMSREEFIMQNEDARKVYEDIMKLRKSVDDLKRTNVEVPEEIRNTPDKTYLKETEEIIAAKQAILEQAKKDALAEKAKREAILRKEEEARLQHQKVLEAQRRAALIEEEAERKRRQAEEAERTAKEVARKAALEAMEAERNARKATSAETAEFFDEKPEPVAAEANLESAKKELEAAQRQQEAKLGMISYAAEVHTERLAAEQQRKLGEQQELIKAKQEEMSAILDEQKEQRIERLTEDVKEKALRRQRALEEKRLREERAKALKAAKLAKLQAEKDAKAAKAIAEREAKAAKALAEREAKAAKLLAEKEAKTAKLLAEREEKRIREEKRRLEKQRKTEERELLKKARKDAEARAKLERLRLEAKSQADAELGGGIVNVQGMTINTEIKEVAAFSWRDLFNIRSKKERKTDSERERRKLERERKHRTEEARRLADALLQRRWLSYQKTAFAKRFNAFKTFCERHKAKLLTAFAVVLMFAMATAGVLNYYTAYAYSYNGKQLGIVKEKDDVLQITDLVQGALTEDKNVDVVIDARSDISFDRVITSEETKIDTSEDVLKRLTYMGDLNVKAYGIFVEGKRVGAVESKAVAEDVFRELENRYTSHMDGAKIEKIEIIEKWEGKKCNASLEDILSMEEMVEALCTSKVHEHLHTVGTDESLQDIATIYSLTKKDILKTNPNVVEKNLMAGDKLVIKTESPVLTVKITEKVTYERVDEYEVKKKDSKDIYEGYTEIEQKGKDGLSEVTSRITLVNGEQVDEDPIVTTVKREAVDEILLVGIKERPPSVGSGKYIWPLKKGTYVFTSGFAWRWGSFHSGIDLGLPEGNPIMAADGGIVTTAGYSGGYGYLVIVDHQNGMETRYAHCSQLLVSEGDEVFQGMEIAKSGNTGYSTGPHLHFEIRVNGVAKDPMNYLP